VWPPARQPVPAVLPLKACFKTKQVQHELASTAEIGFGAFKASTAKALSQGEAWGGGGGGIVIAALLVTI
jgi:hypothetical protein